MKLRKANPCGTRQPNQAMERNDRQVKRIGVTLLLALACLLGVALQAGCTTVSWSPGSKSSSGRTSDQTSAAADLVHLTFSGGSPGTEADLTKQKIAEWNAAHPHIQVKLLEGPVSGTDRYGLYLQTFQAKSPEIDIMMIYVIWPGDLAEHLVDFNQYGGVHVKG